MRLIAHRGFAGEHPENTTVAVSRAGANADAVEVDVRRCASGEPVVIHDETVDRVTDGTGRVADFTREELAELSVLGTNEGVPTLAEVVSALPAGVGLNAELKEEGMADDVLADTRDVEEVVISSFSTEALAECREVDPAVPRAYLVAEDAGMDRARALDCSAVHPHYRLCDTEYVERAHGAGLRVNAWTVTDRRTARLLAGAGVDGLIADRADVLD